jgi:hypothetical protein
MYLLEQLLPPVAVAAAVAATVCALALRGKSARASRVLAAWALGAGYAAGQVFITGGTSFPPTDTTNWLPYFAIMAGVIASLDFFVESKAARLVVFGLACVGVMRLLLAPMFRYGWSAGQGWIWVVCLACATLLLALSVEAMARRGSIAFEPALLLSLVAAGMAGALMLSGSLLLGQFAAVLSAAVLGTLVLTWRGWIDWDGVASVFSLIGVALLVCGYFFAELPTPSAVLLVSAPALALIPYRISAPRWATAARVAVVIAATGGAVLAAFRASPPLSQ